MTSVLVTGGAGYLGSVLTEHLLKNGYKVTIIDSFIHRHPSLLHLIQNDTLHVIRGDVRNTKLLDEQLKKHDVLIPLAALVGAPACDSDPMGAEQINFSSVSYLAQKKSRDQLLLYPNTNSGYGATDGQLECEESSDLNPVSIYGKTKVEAEKKVLATSNSVSFRFATLFGLSPRMRFDLLVNDFVFRALKDRFLVLFEAHFKRNYLHVRDAADVFLFAIENIRQMEGQAYNVGLSDANLSKKELSELIKTYLPSTYIHCAEIGTDPDQRNYIVSNKKINALGFVPQRNLHIGIPELIRGYLSMPLTPFQNA